MSKGWWPVRKVMQYLSYSKNTVHELVRRGDLVAFKGSHGLRISQESVEQFIEAHLVKETEG